MSGYDYNRADKIGKKSDEFKATMSKALKIMDEIPPGSSGATKKAFEIAKQKIFEAEMWVGKACIHSLDGK